MIAKFLDLRTAQWTIKFQLLLSKLVKKFLKLFLNPNLCYFYDQQSILLMNCLYNDCSPPYWFIDNRISRLLWSGMPVPLLIHKTQKNPVKAIVQLLLAFLYWPKVILLSGCHVIRLGTGFKVYILKSKKCNAVEILKGN